MTTDFMHATAQDFQQQPRRAGAAQTFGASAPTSLRAAFIGEGSLLIRCAQAFLAAGHQVALICSGNAAVLEWAQAQDLRTLTLPGAAGSRSEASPEPVSAHLSGLSLDYLFSIAHLRVLPPATLACASRMAINFHDALLPDYPGLNAPAWALMSGAQQHGVTWHEMTAAVDEGRILRQQSFAVAADETALSLNAKCYEAGLSSFKALLTELEGGTPALRPQGPRKLGPAGLFRQAWLRPQAFGSLDFSKPAHEVAALVRALDFGPAPYANPLARPKLWTGRRLLVCTTARDNDGVLQLAPPGTVLAAFDDTLHVACGQGLVILSGCIGLDGKAHGLVTGQRLPALDAALQAQLAGVITRAGQGEAFWFSAYRQLAALALPYPQRMNAPAGAAQPHRLALGLPASGERTVAAFGTWLSALCATPSVMFFYSDAALAEQAQGVEPWLSAWVPLNLSLALSATAAQALAHTQSQLARVQRAGPCTTDLPLRLGTAPAGLAAAKQVGLCLQRAAAGPTAESASANASAAASFNPAAAQLLLTVDDAGQLLLQADSAAFSQQTAERMAAQLAHWLKTFDEAVCHTAHEATLASLSWVPPSEAALLEQINSTQQRFARHQLVHDLIAEQARKQGDALALECGDERLSFAELNARSDALARRLKTRGVQPGDLVGLCLGREAALVLGLLAIWKAGAAYLPLDPAYPAHRLDFMLKDSGAKLVLTTRVQALALGLEESQALCLDEDSEAIAGEAQTRSGPSMAVATAEEVCEHAKRGTEDKPQPNAATQADIPESADSSAQRVAYVIYTSGSTGQPKGVMVTHRNVMNFFAGMDARIQLQPGARWLAVTSLSFDISVLELCWTLARGLSVVLHGSPARAKARGPAFSLFYFGNDQSQEKAAHSADQVGKEATSAAAETQTQTQAQTQVQAQTSTRKPTPSSYRLLLEGARFADRHGFAAVWTPERHFHLFGGQYPNPTLTSAAVAAITERVQIRAGSYVLPLHHPLRAAEDWAVVDQLSGGRVGVSFAAGWQPQDFVLAPGAFADRKVGMFSAIEQVRKLWRGEALAFDGPQGQVKVQTRPRPVQAEIPVWITAAANPETFEQAGALGYHLLTHLLGQTVPELAQKITLYRSAWDKAGHTGRGQVSLMLHTFVGEDEDAVRAIVREPMKAYLRSSVDLIRQAAWTFPTFVQRSNASGKSPLEIMESQALSEEDMDALLEHAFARYDKGSALFGSQARCLAMVSRLRDAGVDDVACLIDFGVPTDTALAHLNDLQQLMQAAQAPVAAPQAYVASELLKLGITHLQCTPSMAAMLVADAQGRQALSRLSALLVGGEALPLALARQLRELVPGQVLNMYGPTETTVWSTVHEIQTLSELSEANSVVPLGQPIANTRLVVRNAAGLACPALVPGELLIGGEGVTLGYLGRPALTTERFIDDPLHPGQRLYRTGDLVRWHVDGRLEFLGRTDHQVKVRGHRIELGEIESQLMSQPGVAQAVVLARTDASDPAAGPRLQAYVLAHSGVQLQPDALRQALAAELPAIMVPASVLVMTAFPLTPNGKIDRLALPDSRAPIVLKPAAASEALPSTPSTTPFSTRSATDELLSRTVTAATPAQAASTEAESTFEQTIVALWQEVLGLSQVGVNDNFFDLGGHSLLVVQVQRRLSELTGQDVSITDMFRFPTIRGLARHLAGQTVSTAVNEGWGRAQARRQLRVRGGTAAQGRTDSPSKRPGSVS